MVWFLAFIFIIFVPVLRNPKISFRNSLQRVLVCTVLIGLAVLTFASMGGGKKSKTTAVKNDFVPIRTSNGFTLKSGPLYKGSSIISQEKSRNTIVLNSYGLETTTIAALMAFNGIPDPSNPTGRYSGIIMKPFIAISGSVLDDPSAITDLYPNEVTIAVAPAPGSAGLPMEAAANMTLLYAIQAQNSPHLDVSGQNYPDMPVSTTWSTAAMSVYNTRDSIVKKGCSTVNVVGGVYQVQDFVTTYHPDGEVPPQFRYCRNLNIDFNIRYSYYLKEQIYVVDHVIAADEDTVTATNVVKPKTWKSEVDQMADDFAARALIVQPAFMQSSIVVNIGTSNPDRLETFFRYKRSGYARIASTTAEAGFNFGTL